MKLEESLQCILVCFLVWVWFGYFVLFSFFNENHVCLEKSGLCSGEKDIKVCLIYCLHHHFFMFYVTCLLYSLEGIL